MWMAEWIMKPAGFTRNGLSITLLPSLSIFTSDEAVTRSNSTPCGLIRKCLLSLPGTLSEVWVPVRSAML